MGTVPGNLVAVLVLLTALAPGLLYRRRLRRYVIQDDRSAAVEIIELFGVGASATLVSLMAVAGVAEFSPGLVSLSEAVDRTVQADDAWRVVLTAGAVLSLSTSLCLGVGVVAGLRSSQRVGSVHEGWTWTRQLARRDKGRPVYVAVELTDGRLIEGYVRAVSAGEEVHQRCLVLQGPLAISGPLATPRTRSTADFIMLPGNTIGAIHGRYIPHAELIHNGQSDEAKLPTTTS